MHEKDQAMQMLFTIPVLIMQSLYAYVNENKVLMIVT